MTDGALRYSVVSAAVLDGLESVSQVTELPKYLDPVVNLLIVDLQRYEVQLQCDRSDGRPVP